MEFEIEDTDQSNHRVIRSIPSPSGRRATIVSQAVKPPTLKLRLYGNHKSSLLNIDH